MAGIPRSILKLGEAFVISTLRHAELAKIATTQVATWRRPEIEAEIKFTERTAGGPLRHA